MEQIKTVNATINMPETTYALLKKVAERDGRSFSNYAYQVLLKHLQDIGAIDGETKR